MGKVTSVRLSDEVLAKLDEMGAAMQRSRAWLIQDAVARYVQDEHGQVMAIKGAVDEYRAGKTQLRPFDEVKADLDALLKAGRND
jgi:predicted transcriptional regulator